MARLYLFAEGQTELTFADTVIKPYLANFGDIPAGRQYWSHMPRRRGEFFAAAGAITCR